MTTNTVKNAKMTTESVVNNVFFETLATKKFATDKKQSTKQLQHILWRQQNSACGPPSLQS